MSFLDHSLAYCFFACEKTKDVVHRVSWLVRAFLLLSLHSYISSVLSLALLSVFILFTSSLLSYMLYETVSNLCSNLLFLLSDTGLWPSRVLTKLLSLIARLITHFIQFMMPAVLTSALLNVSLFFCNKFYVRFMSWWNLAFCMLSIHFIFIASNRHSAYA